ncbi:MAG: hypothetical protein QW609_02195 [Candidatus Aenigmatarchaeota archaeon]
MGDKTKGIAGEIIVIVITIIAATLGIILLWFFHQKIYFALIQVVEGAIRGIKEMFGL